MDNFGAGATPFVFLRVVSRTVAKSGEMVLSSAVVIERVTNGASFLTEFGVEVLLPLPPGLVVLP
jgi:hypothetical protein